MLGNRLVAERSQNGLRFLHQQGSQIGIAFLY